jgi:hypothetical protein
MSFGVDNLMFSKGGEKWCYLPNTRSTWTPHLEYIHCMTHHTNLNNANFISNPYCETYWEFASIIYLFIYYNSKIHLEFFKLANFMKEKGNKILWNVKTH